MALTLSAVTPGQTGNRRTSQCVLAFDSSYPTGGEALTPGQVGLQVIESASIEPKGGYVFEYDYTNQKIKVFSGGGADITPAGSITGEELAAHQHAIDANYLADVTGVTIPVIALTHNAGPEANLDATALLIEENAGYSVSNVARLWSTTNGNADVLGETANGTVYGAAASARFFVNDSDTPFGVQIYVNEAASDQLEFVSPTGEDTCLIMPLETGYGFALAVTVHHNADAASGKALFFDDNGAADAQLVFVDTGTTGGVIPEGDIAIMAPSYVKLEQGGLGLSDSITAGTPAASFAGEAVSAGAADEVDNGTNLATLTGVRCTFTGY